MRETRYVKSVKASKGKHEITYVNGEKSNSYDSACFFMIMQDKKVKPCDLISYIKIGRLSDSTKNWNEIERIAKTFSQGNQNVFKR